MGHPLLMKIRGDEDISQLPGMPFERPHNTALDQMCVDLFELIPAIESSVCVYDFIEQARHVIPRASRVPSSYPPMHLPA